MRICFVDKTNGPERMVCDAEIVFEEGPLAGMKLTGFAIWRTGGYHSTEPGELYVTFPSRAFGSATDRKFFDYLRAVEPGATKSKAVKDWILEEYKAQVLGQPRAAALADAETEPLENLEAAAVIAEKAGLGPITSASPQQQAKVQDAEPGVYGLGPIPGLEPETADGVATPEVTEKFAPRTKVAPAPLPESDSRFRKVEKVESDDNGGF